MHHFCFKCLYLLLLLVSPDINPVLFVLDIHMKYLADVVPLCTLLRGLLLYDGSPICKKSCVIAHRYTIDDNSECPMYYELSLLTKVFPCLCLSIKMNYSVT